MKKYAYIIILALFALVLMKFLWPKEDASAGNFKLGSMSISSSAFQTEQYIPDKYGCRGQNINPPLSFEYVPSKAKSLALVVLDPDPTGTFTHWIVFNIPPTLAGFEENKIPTGIEAKNSAGLTAYTGPCPPSGTHSYHFMLYALDKTLDSGFVQGKATFDHAIAGHVLEQADLVGLFSN